MFYLTAPVDFNEDLDNNNALCKRLYGKHKRGPKWFV